MTPSTVEVYVNGTLVRREEIGPGAFDLRNLPVAVGSGQTRIVVRDAFGRETTQSSSYYLGPGLLAQGLTEKIVAAGARRLDTTTRSWDYGEVAGLASYRRGFTRWFTAGLRVEGAQSFASGGPTASFGLPVGELSGSVAVSSRDGQTGTAGAAQYTYLGRRFTMAVTGRAMSADYANLGLDATIDRPRLEGRGLFGTSVGRWVSLSLQVQRTDWRDRGEEDRVALIGNAPIGRGFNLFANGSHSWGPAVSGGSDVFVGIAWAPLPRLTALAGWSGREDASDRVGSFHGEVQRSLPLGPGVGFRVVGDSGPGQLAIGELRAQGDSGRIEATVQRDYGVTSSMLRLSGGVVVIGGRVFLSRPVDGSFALLQVPGVPGVRSTLSNQEVGRTDSHGNLLVPNLLPYYGNRLAINDKDIPLEYDIAANEMTIAPSFRGGSVVRFPVRRLQSAAGKVVVATGESRVAPSYGQITVLVDGKAVVSPLNAEGEFYLEEVPAGAHRAEVEFAQGVCTFELVVPASAAALAEVGTVTCRMPAAPAAP